MGIKTPHDELMKALEAWERSVTDMVNADTGDYLFDVEEAYRAYRNAPKPLILEPVKWESLKEWDRFIRVSGKAVQQLIRGGKESDAPTGDLYKLSETD